MNEKPRNIEDVSRRSEMAIPDIGSPTRALQFVGWAARSRVLPRGYSWPLVLLPAWVWGGESIRTNTSVGPMYVRTSDRSSSSLLFFGFLPHEQRESRLVTSLAARCQALFDIGAQYGWYTRLMALASPSARIYSFEPDPVTYQYLAANTLDLPNVASFQAAVGAKTKPTTFWRAKTSDLSSAVRCVGEPISVDCYTLDDFCRKHDLTGVDFIKCDVEGGEEFVLRGALNLMNVASPPIWMLEIIDSFLSEAGSTTKTLLEILRESCPAGKIFTQDADARPIEITDVSKRLIGNNVFFVPPSRLELFNECAEGLRKESQCP